MTGDIQEAPEGKAGTAPAVQGHWAEKTEQAWQMQQEDTQAFLESNDQGANGDYEDDRLTPRSVAEYSKASSLPSEAPVFYEEEPVTLSRVEEVLAIEHGLRQACKTLPVTTMSWVFFTLMIFYHGQVMGSFDSADTIKQSMMSINVPAVNNTVTLRELRLGTITERYDIIQWMRLGLVPAVTIPGLKHGQLRRTQQLLGKIRVAQTRSVPQTCNMDAALERFYTGMCHPAGGDAQAYGTTKIDYSMAFEPYRIGSEKGMFVAWIDIGRPTETLEKQFQSWLVKWYTYQGKYCPMGREVRSKEDCFKAAAFLGPKPFRGSMNTPGGWAYCYHDGEGNIWYNEAGDQASSVPLLSHMSYESVCYEDYDWLDDSTQDVTIEAMFLNPEMNVYSKLSIKFALHRGGWIQQDVNVTPMRGDVYYHWAVIWLDAMWIFAIFCLIWQATLHAWEEISKGLFWMWFTDWFVWIDCLSILGGAGLAVYFYHISTIVDDFNALVSRLGAMPSKNGIEAAVVWKTRYILQNFNYEKSAQGILDDFDSLTTHFEWLRCLCLWYNLNAVCRFYRGFTGQPRIAIILQTIAQVSNFMIHYLIVFCVVMANFTMAGYILFGEQLHQWSTIGKSTCSAFLMLFGRFDYNELHEVAPVNAAFWFGSFFLLVVLVITGLTTSTILHHYLSVRVKTSQAGESIVKQLWGMIGDMCYSRTYDGAQKSLPPDKLFEMVTKDTDPLKIRHLGRFNIDRRMRTRHDVYEAETDPKVDVDFLIGRGMDPVTAERLLFRIAEAGHHIETRSSPVHRLTLFIARQMSMLRFGAEHMRTKTTNKVSWAAKAVDRLDLKHSKCVGLAKRIRRAQELPPGWTSHVDTSGRRYLRQEETGLTSWTLPRHLI